MAVHFISVRYTAPAHIKEWQKQNSVIHIRKVVVSKLANDKLVKDCKILNREIAEKTLMKNVHVVGYRQTVQT